MSTPAVRVERTDPTEPLYRLAAVERRYLRGEAAVVALRAIDLEIARGEFLSIEGPSGSGKSTLLQVVGALDTPTSGSVHFDGRDLSRARDGVLTAIRAGRIGFIFQQFNLIPTLTAADNIAIAVDPKLSRAERRNRATELLASVGLEHRGRHLPSRMSGGEQQRVAIARALANRPEVIIADEPTGNLDSTSAGQVMSLLAGLRSERDVTLIVATHDEEVARHASRRIRMRDGAIVSASPAPLAPGTPLESGAGDPPLHPS